MLGIVLLLKNDGPLIYSCKTSIDACVQMLLTILKAHK